MNNLSDPLLLMDSITQKQSGSFTFTPLTLHSKPHSPANVQHSSQYDSQGQTDPVLVDCTMIHISSTSQTSQTQPSQLIVITFDIDFNLVSLRINVLDSSCDLDILHSAAHSSANSVCNPSQWRMMNYLPTDSYIVMAIKTFKWLESGLWIVWIR